jgi:beta-lactamase regulating signal transducer with metallopeptidase domain
MLVDLLINWAWQGCAVTLAAWAILRVGGLSATAKYQVWWGALLLVVLLPAAPGFLGLFDASRTAGTATGAPVAEIPIPRLARWPVLAALSVWGVGASIALLRALRAHRALNRVRASARPFPAAREQRLANWIGLRGTGRQARLVISDEVRAAAVLGLASPVIAVSSAAERTLTDSDLDLVLVHEWAHVQRRDDVARLAQVVIRGLAWMHPAVRTIDRQLDIEREVACDDWVVNVAGGARDLARCLTTLAEMPHAAAGDLLAPGAVEATSLSIRVRRLLDAGRSTRTRSSLTKLGPLAATLGAVALAISGVQLVGVASPAILPVPQHATGLAGSLKYQQRVASSPASGERPMDEAAAAPVADAGQPRIRPAETPSPQVDGAGRVPVLVTAGPLDSLAPAHRTAWTPPALPAPDTTPARPPRLEEPAAGSGASDVAADTPWAAATAAGLSVARGSQRAADAAADAGTSVGRGSQHAATATAGFFTRFGRRIAGSF